MTDTGVVDPIRVPASVQAFVRGLPRIALIFIALAIVDVIGRFLGVIEPGMYLSSANATSFLTAFVPHDALILLPALVVLRRPDAETATPWVFWGALIVALVELLWVPTRGIVVGLLAPEDDAATFALSFVGITLTGIGWLVLGRGLATLNPRSPEGWVAGLANLAAALVAVAIVFELVRMAIGPSNVVDPDVGGALDLNFAGASFGLLAWAYLIRSVLRGLDDPSRSLTVTRIAAVGALLSAVATFLIAVVSVIYAINFTLALQIGNGLGQGLYLAGDTIGITLIVVAIALGFADPLRPMPKDWDKATAG